MTNSFLESFKLHSSGLDSLHKSFVIRKVLSPKPSIHALYSDYPFSLLSIFSAPPVFSIHGTLKHSNTGRYVISLPTHTSSVRLCSHLSRLNLFASTSFAAIASFFPPLRSHTSTLSTYKERHKGNVFGAFLSLNCRLAILTAFHIT